MARRMYDLDNGIEKIKVASLDTSVIKADNNVRIELDGTGLSLVAGDNDNPIKCFSPLLLPGYPTSSRPSTFMGTIIYDTNLNKCILYNGTAWVNLDGTALS